MELWEKITLFRIVLPSQDRDSSTLANLTFVFLHNKLEFWCYCLVLSTPHAIFGRFSWLFFFIFDSCFKLCVCRNYNELQIWKIVMKNRSKIWCKLRKWLLKGLLEVFIWISFQQLRLLRRTSCWQMNQKKPCKSPSKV